MEVNTIPDLERKIKKFKSEAKRYWNFPEARDGYLQLVEDYTIRLIELQAMEMKGA